ncbi:hypothetical protein BGZ54_001063 [Gamsiella multidivaricata]|nr:hypothetical protein BGZ54_001063 [Gamsiella multidivaricata]
METTTMSKLQDDIKHLYPELDGTETIAVRYRNDGGQPALTGNPIDKFLQDILKRVHTSALEVVVAVETPSKPFSTYTLTDINKRFGFFKYSDPTLSDTAPFEPIANISEFMDQQDEAFEWLDGELQTRKKYSILDSVEGVAGAMQSFLVQAVGLFADDLKLTAGKDIKGKQC